MNTSQAVIGHEQHHTSGSSGDCLGHSLNSSTGLGSPFVAMSDPLSYGEVVGTPSYVSHHDIVIRPSSPTPTVDSSTFSFIHIDAEIRRTPLKSILPRLWHVISPSMRSQHLFALPHSSVASVHQFSKGKMKARVLNGSNVLPQHLDYSELEPLDGEEGELVTVDDEACFFNDAYIRSRAVTGMDILGHLPTELSLYIFSLLCTSNQTLLERLLNTSSTSNLSLPEIHDPLYSILACLSVSRTWRALASDNTVWRSLFLSRWFIDLMRHRVSSFSRPSIQLSNWFPGIRQQPLYSKSPVITTTKGLRLKMKKKAYKGFPQTSGSNNSPTFCVHRSCHNLPLLSPPSLRGSASTGSTPISSIANPGSLSRSSSCSADLGSKGQTTQSPLRFNWYALYRERFELERRWNGTTRITFPLHLPLAESTRKISLSTSSSCTFGYPGVNSPLRMQLQEAISAKSVPFTPQIFSIGGHADSVYCLEFDSKRIITGSRDQTIKVWSLKSTKLLGSFGGVTDTGRGSNPDTVEGHTGSVLCLKFSHDWDKQDCSCEGTKGFMVSGSSDCTVCVWELYIGRKLGGREGEKERDDDREVHANVRAVLCGHSGGVLDLRIDNKWIVSCSKDAVVCVWNRKTLELRRALRGHEGPVNAVGLQNGKIVSASGDGKMILWDIESGERLRTFEGHNRGLACIDFKDDLIVSGSNDCKINLWSASTGRCIRTLEGHEALVRALSFDPKSGRLVSASYDKSVKVWDLLSGKVIREFKNIHTSHIFDVKFDVARIVSTSHDRKIVILDFSNGTDTSFFV